MKVLDLVAQRILELVEAALAVDFDYTLGSYVYKVTGRPVAQSVMLGWQDKYTSVVKDRLEVLTQKFVDGGITMDKWQLQAAQEIKDGWLKCLRLLVVAVAFMTQADWGRTGGRLQYEYQKLNNFATAIDMGELSDAQIKARIQLYANATRVGYYDGLTSAKIDAGYTHEQRFLNPAEHCDDCVEYAAMGIVIIGTLPEPGEASQCGRNCKCTKEYLTPKEAEEAYKESYDDQQVSYIDYGDDWKAAQKGLMKNFEEWMNTLTYDEEDAFLKFSGRSYRPINQYLRTGEWPSNLDAKDITRLTEQIQSLSSAATKAPCLDSPTLFWRGFQSDDVLAAINKGDLAVGDIIKEPAFLSTSGLKETAQKFGGAVTKQDKIFYRIEAGAGSKGMYIGGHGLTRFPGEVEFLLPPGSELRILGIKQAGKKGYEIAVRLL